MKGELKHLHHFDTRIKIIQPQHAKPLEVGDQVQLPNGVRLKIWSVDRENQIKAKTTKIIEEDLRGYLPLEMYLVYTRVHGRITDRAS